MGAVIEVTSIRHTVSNKPVFGKYFVFDPASIDLDALLGEDYNTKTWRVYNARTRSVMKVRLWKEGWGRKDPWNFITEDDWHYGDRMVLDLGASETCGSELYCLPVGDDEDFACKANPF